ncbi:MAG: adenine deaminase C-terminal domain-containing protein, partial [Saprospiraceae bacterium]
PVDGHAPGLRGEVAAAYATAGITTDHECFTEAEARDKLAAGMKILIREGSAARNYAALEGLIDEFPDRLMFCTDDSHPNDLLNGHIDRLVIRAVRGGHDLWNVLQIACRNPVRHYQLDIGQLRVGDPGDFICVDDLRHFGIMQTWRRGRLIAEAGAHLMGETTTETPNIFLARPLRADDLRVPARPDARLRVIRVHDGELMTGTEWMKPSIAAGHAVTATSHDLLKIVVVNRYQPGAPPAIAFVTGMKMQRGAIASSVAHDSHNIVAVGVTDEDLAAAINTVIANRGGIAAAREDRTESLALPIAGLMSDERGPRVADRYSYVSGFARRGLRCQLEAPFMTLSFLALLVIPELKLSDRGLFDGNAFAFTNLWD